MIYVYDTFSLLIITIIFSNIISLAIENTALQWLADISDGDARIALSNLQLVIQDSLNEMGKTITVSDIKEGLKVFKKDNVLLKLTLNL